MDRNEEYKKVFGVNPRKPKKSKKPVTATKRTSKRVSNDPIVAEADMELVGADWNYDVKKKKQPVADKKTKNNIRFLFGLLIVFAVMLLIGWIISLLRGNPVKEQIDEPESSVVSFNKDDYDAFEFNKSAGIACDAIRPECGVCKYKNGEVWADGIIEEDICYLPKVEAKELKAQD